MILRAGTIAMMCSIASAAFAAETPLTLYLAGQYSQAEAAGVAENDAQGLAIAARAALADESMRDEPCLDCVRHAEDLSRRAIAADPKLPEGHIYLAAAFGLEARIIGEFAAQSKGIASRAKKELDAALESDPNDPWTLAALGSWNIEVVKNAGSTLASWLFGASVETGEDDFAKAFALDPNNLVLRYQYALTLAAYDLSERQQSIEEALSRAVAGTPHSAYETFVQERAKQLLNGLQKGDVSDVERLVRHDQGYPA